MAATTLTERLRAGGIVAPRIVVAEARRAGLRLPIACAMLEKETSGGHNVFGHDPTIFAGAGAVTEARYREYKRRRVASGNRLMQGVGPCQLTYYTLQDEADAQGGCWRPEVNMRVGFRHLAALISQYGEADGARRYNGSGDAAVAYSADLRAKARKWEAVLAGTLAAARPRLVRAGDTGELVEKITRRLSFVRSRVTKAPYLDGARRRLDAEAAAALKAFQRDHALSDDGIFGPDTARRLNRAVRAEKRRRRTAPSAPAPQPQAPTRLPALVAEVRRLDDETDRAWRALVAHAHRRRRLLARAARPRPGSETVKALAEMTAILRRIEGRLDALVGAGEPESAAAAGTSGSRAVATVTEVSEATVEKAPEATVTQVSEATVTQVAVPATPVNGQGGAERRRRLSELSEAELEERIVRLDRMMDSARSELIRRYAHVEERLAKLAPAPAPRPRRDAPRKPPAPVRDRQGGKVVTTKLGDSGLVVRRSKLALARFLAAKGNPEHAQLRRALTREARTPGARGALATPLWQKGVRAAQHLTRRPVSGELDGELTRALAPYWPRDNIVKRVVRSTPAWRVIPGQLTPNFNIGELACKDSARTAYVQGLMREQGLSKQAARERAKGLANRLERVRRAGGDRPLIVTSAFRTKAYNASLTGSASNSAHTRGFAADTPPPPGISLDTHHKHVLAAFECGVGYYPAGRGYFIHGDFDHTLGGRRTW